MRKGLGRIASSLMLCLASLGMAASEAAAAKYKVLNFYGVGGFLHDVWPTSNRYIDSLALALDFQLTTTKDAAVFTAENLAQYQAVILNNCTKLGDTANKEAWANPLNAKQRKAFMDFTKAKGVVAWHGTADQGGTWPELAEYLGGEFVHHGAGNGTIKPDPAGKGHPVGAGLDSGRFNDEWYSFGKNPRLTPGITVLYTLDEEGCDNCHLQSMLTNGKIDHPIAWVRSLPTGGRLFYSGTGHTPWTYTEVKLTRTLIKQGLAWALAAGPTTQAVLAPRKPTHMSIQTLGPGLEVAMYGSGRHTLTIRTLDGRRMAERIGWGPAHYSFAAPRISAPFTLTATTDAGRSTRLVR